jgi:hypothetical protein
VVSNAFGDCARARNEKTGWCLQLELQSQAPLFPALSRLCRIGFGKQTLDLTASRLSVPIDDSKIATSNNSMPIDENRGRHTLREVRPEDFSIFVAQDIERQSQGSCKREDSLVASTIHTYRSNTEAAICEFRIQLLYRCHFTSAVSAPRCPHHNEENVAFVISKRAYDWLRSECMCLEIESGSIRSPCALRAGHASC